MLEEERDEEDGGEQAVGVEELPEAAVVAGGVERQALEDVAEPQPEHERGGEAREGERASPRPSASAGPRACCGTRWRRRG